MLDNNTKNFIIEFEKDIEYEGDDYVVRRKERSPFDLWDVGIHRNICTWVQYKIKYGFTDLTIEEYNEWIIDHFITEPFFWNRSRDKAIIKAKDWLL